MAKPLMVVLGGLWRDLRSRPTWTSLRAFRVRGLLNVSVAAVLIAAACSNGGDDATRETSARRESAERADTQVTGTQAADTDPANQDSEGTEAPPTDTATGTTPANENSEGTEAPPTDTVQDDDQVSSAISQLLAQVYTTSEEGDGIETGCRRRETDTQAVEISDSWGNDPANWGTPVVLCIYGFRDDLPIKVSTTIDGSTEWVTTFQPSDEGRHPLYPGAVCTEEESTWCARPRESIELLFEDSTRPIYRSTEGPWLETNDWVLATSLANRIELAGGFRIEVSQEGESAFFDVLPSKPRTDYGLVSWLEQRDGTGDELVIYGFERGQRLPLGLYAPETSTANGGSIGSCPTAFRLVTPIGDVEIPPTGFAVFRVPEDVLETIQTGTYSIAGRATDGYSESALWIDGERRGKCQVQSAFVEEPSSGSLRFAHYGSRVSRLNEELVRRGYLDPIDPVPLNLPGGLDLGITSDQYFGYNTAWAVREFQSENGLVVDGIAGPLTHEALGIPY